MTTLKLDNIRFRKAMISYCFYVVWDDNFPNTLHIFPSTVSVIVSIDFQNICSSPVSVKNSVYAVSTVAADIKNATDNCSGIPSRRCILYNFSNYA